MNWDKVQGNWKQFKQRAKKKKAGITTDDAELIAQADFPEPRVRPKKTTVRAIREAVKEVYKE